MITDEEIMESIANYCQSNLMKDKRFEICSWKEDDNEYNISMEDFICTLDKFRKKDTNTYDFLIYAGDRYKNAVFQLCKRILLKEEIPTDFNNTTLQMLYKGKRTY